MVDVGPLSPWRPSWMTDTSGWLYSPLTGFAHSKARTAGGDLMSGQPTPVTVSKVLNVPAGDVWIDMPPGTQIMADDLDWMTQGWEAVFLIEWKVRQAEHGPDHTWGEWGELYHGGELDWRRCQRCEARDSRPWQTEER